VLSPADRRADAIADLAARVRALDCERTITGISGFGGSGKSTTADLLAEHLKDAFVARGDQFIVDRAMARCTDWSTFDRARLQKQLLDPFRATGTVHYQKYDWDIDGLGPWQEASGVRHLIVEGVGLFHPSQIHQFDVRVWMDCPPRVATERAVARDRGQGEPEDVIALWYTIWAPNDADFFALYAPRERADVVIDSA
jgi:uridine kinase